LNIKEKMNWYHSSKQKVNCKTKSLRGKNETS
jgi:hypothetical protein